MFSYHILIIIKIFRNVVFIAILGLCQNVKRENIKEFTSENFEFVKIKSLFFQYDKIIFKDFQIKQWSINISYNFKTIGNDADFDSVFPFWDSHFDTFYINLHTACILQNILNEFNIPHCSYHKSHDEPANKISDC